MAGRDQSAEAQGVSCPLSRVFSDCLRLARNPQFPASAGVVALTAAAAMTLPTVFPAALTDLFGKSPDVVGYCTSAYSVIAHLGALVSAQLVEKPGLSRLMASGLATIAIYFSGHLVWSQALSFSLTNIFVSVSVVGFGQSIIVFTGFFRAVQADDALPGDGVGVRWSPSVDRERRIHCGGRECLRVWDLHVAGRGSWLFASIFGDLRRAVLVRTPE